MEEAVEATKVRGRYLSAIEQGDLRSLPGKVYARGFVRSYSEYLGLDGDEVTNLYLGFQRDEARPLVPQSRAAEMGARESGRAARRRRRAGVAAAAAIATVPMRTRSGRFGLFTLGVAVFTALALHYELNGSGASGPNVVPATHARQGGTQPSAAAPTPGARTDPASGARHRAVLPAVSLTKMKANASGATYRVTGKGPVKLALTTVSGRCWVQVTADNQPVYVQTVPQGQTVTFSAKRSMQVALGAAPVIKMTVDGLPVPPTSTWVYGYTFLHKS